MESPRTAIHAVKPDNIAPFWAAAATTNRFNIPARIKHTMGAVSLNDKF